MRPGRDQGRHGGREQLLAGQWLRDGRDRGLGVIQRAQRVVEVDVRLEFDEVRHGEGGGEMRGDGGVLAGDHGPGLLPCHRLFEACGRGLAQVIVLHHNCH